MLSMEQRLGGLLSQSSRTAVADATGNFAFTQLGSGPHQLRIDAPGFQTSFQDIASTADSTPRLFQIR
jgi:hypothetical protein